MQLVGRELMKHAAFLVSLVAAAGLGGCVAVAKNEVGKEFARVCAEKGADNRVVPGEYVSRGGMFGTVSMTGDCLAPGDEGYEDAMPVEEYLDSIGRRSAQP